MSIVNVIHLNVENLKLYHRPFPVTLILPTLKVEVEDQII